MKYVVTRKPNYLNLFDDFDQFFNDFWKTVPARNVRVPSVDIQEHESGYSLDAELPGYDEEDIDVRVEDHILTIESRKNTETEKGNAADADTANGSGTSKKETDSEEKLSNRSAGRSSKNSYLIRERNVTSFRRTFRLPEGVDEDKIQGEYRNGVLHLEIPKAPEKQPKKIAVKIA